MAKQSTSMTDAQAHLARYDPVMAQLIKDYPAPILEKHDDYYEQMVSSIIGQQLSVFAAKVIKERFVELFGGAFPSPEQVVNQDVENIKSAGLGRMKASYVQDLAQKVIDGIVEFKKFDQMENQAIIDELVKVKGIGEWTAHMFLIFALARPDVLPIGDLGVRNAVTKLYKLDETANPDKVTQIAKDNHWHPYESIASLYTWKSLENIPANLLP